MPLNSSLGNKARFCLQITIINSSTIVKDNMVIPKDLEAELPFHPAILLSGIVPKEYKSFCYKDICMHMFIAALFTIAKTWN